MAFTFEDALDFAERISGSVKITNELEFADIMAVAPDINLYPDDQQYFDPAAREIHLGVKGIFDMFHPGDEAEFLCALNFIRGHESQHRRSTATSAYANAVKGGCEAVVDYIHSREGGGKAHLRSDADYANYVNETLRKKDIYVSWEMVRNIVAGIANSVEDGRIERIRSNRIPSFEKLRLIHRGIFWQNADDNFPLYAEIKAADRLRILTNQILSLATCQLYEKGFVQNYFDTPLMAEIKPFMPYIAAAVMSGRCRGIIAPVRSISEKLAPYIYEVCKISKEDMEQKAEFEKFLQNIMSSLLDASPQGELSENAEDTDDGSCNSTFSHSDLCVEVDKETYDKLKKQSENGENGDGEGLMIRCSDSGKESGKSGEKTSGNKDGEKSESSSENKDGEKKDCNGNNKKGHEKDEKTDNGPAAYSDAGKSGSLDASSDKGGNGRTKGEKHVSRDIAAAAEAAVIAAMKEAAMNAKAEADATVNQAYNAKARDTAGSIRAKEIFDSEKPITAADMKDICDFKELKRAYTVRDALPPVLESRGKTLRRKNEQYFRSLKAPTISFRDSGSIDPSRIYGLAMGDTEIFRKKGQTKEFDGCAYILVDNSGSMYGNKRQEACKAAAVIEEAFKGLFPFKIVAFDQCGEVIHEVIKGWDESLKKNCCWNFFKYGRSGAGNEDGFDSATCFSTSLKR